MKTLVSWGRNPLLSLWIFFPFAFPYVSIFTDLVIRKNEVKIENEGKSEKEPKRPEIRKLMRVLVQDGEKKRGHE